MTVHFFCPMFSLTTFSSGVDAGPGVPFPTEVGQQENAGGKRPDGEGGQNAECSGHSSHNKGNHTGTYDSQ